MNPYIGDRQLDPPKDHTCPFCGYEAQSQHGLMLHVSRCPKNDDVEIPDDDPGEWM